MTDKRARERAFPLPACVCLLLLCGSASFDASADKKASTRQHSPPFTLTIKSDRLSLIAKDAPVKAVLADLGRRLHVEVVVKPPQNEKITTEFQDLTLDQALQQLSQRYAATRDKQGRIVKVVVVPKAQRSAAANDESLSQAKLKEPGQSSKAGSPRNSEPFKFEFDPSAAGPEH